MPRRIRSTPRLATTAAIAAALSLLSGCASVWDGAGDRRFIAWPFTEKIDWDLKLNYPPIDPAKLQLDRSPDPYRFISPQPPVDPRVTSPYSQAEPVPPLALAAVGDNAACAARCESPSPGARLAPRVDVRDGGRATSP
jgi:hypothetical protein